MSSVFDPLRLGAVAMDVLSSGRASAQALASRQQTRLSALLTAAQRRSPLYHERLRGMPVQTAALCKVPTVSRAELMARFDDWVTDPELSLSGLRDFTADSARIGEPYLGKYLIWESSGTSHLPGVFVQDARTMAVYDALEALRRNVPRPLLRWFDPLLQAERIAFVGATTGHYASMVTLQRLRQLNPWLAHSLRCFSILQPTVDLLDELNVFAPTVIATYPTVASLLADAAQGGILKFSPKEVWTGGETLSKPVRSHLEQALKCIVRNSYGASEFMSIGWECSRGQLHANTDWVILEPIDEVGHPMPLGQASHSTLLTNLANYVQPLIRYDLGDQMTVCTDRCSCGSSLPVIAVQGRCDDSLQMTGVHGQPVTVLALALTTILEEDAGVFDFQLRQSDEHTLKLRLGLDGPAAQEALKRCRVLLDRFALTQGLAPIRLEPEFGQTITRGSSGKARRVVALPSRSNS